MRPRIIFSNDGPVQSQFRASHEIQDCPDTAKAVSGRNQICRSSSSWIGPYILTFLVLLTVCVAAAAQSPAQHALLRKPTLSKTQIAFSYGGDLWIVDRSGGEARRLTSDVGIETDPVFSPDGKMIAFTGEYDGNEDIYVMAARGGIPRRLTSHPEADQVVGWTRDGERILFRSRRETYSGFTGFTRLYTVSVSGGPAEALPLPMAVEGSYSPDGSYIAYVPFANFFQSWQFQLALKHYRGGKASPIWIARLADSTVTKIPRSDSNDSSPMWINNQIYFLSDRGGPVNLYTYDTTTKTVTEAFQSDGLDIKSVSAGPDAIVYEQFGSIHVFDLTTRKRNAVAITVSGDFPAARPRYLNVAGQIQNANISPTGVRAVFEAHGEILTVPAEHGQIRNLTNTPGAAERDPAWSPDGKWIAYFSDEAGEYALHLREQDGAAIKKFELGNSPSFYYSPTWSPDSKRIAYSDKRLNLWILDIATGKSVLVDTNPYDDGARDFKPAWSPDSRWLAYTRQIDGALHAIFVYSSERKHVYQITDGLSDSTSATFDKSGDYLYFLASTDDGPILASSMAGYMGSVTRSVYVVILGASTRSPLAPRSDEEKVALSANPSGGFGSSPAAIVERNGCQVDDETAEMARLTPDPGKTRDQRLGNGDAARELKIDFQNISHRILALPLQARNYTRVLTGKSHALYLLEAPAGPSGETVYSFDLCTGKEQKLIEGVRLFDISFDGKKVLYQLPGGSQEGDSSDSRSTWVISSVDAVGKPTGSEGKGGALALDSMMVYVDPRPEWHQMFREVGRIERDFFYDPNLHGVNLNQLMAEYEPYVNDLVSRPDLNYLFADMLGEITAQHLYVYGGNRPKLVSQANVGLLGADYTVDGNRYRFLKVYAGESWNPNLRAPLTEPGVNVLEGEYLLAVDGREIYGDDEIYSFFAGKAGKAVQLRVGPSPRERDTRSVRVVPIDSERALRLRDWMESNRRMVDQLSEGRLAYIYLPDTSTSGYSAFNRYYFAQTSREGAIIDERFNSGGLIADYILDWLRRPMLAAAVTREGNGDVIPRGIYGPKAMLINEHSSSGGDALPWMFRKLGIGALIGTRTWGGLIGIGGYPTLIDGGVVTAPRTALFNPESGEFDVENKGVSPDLEVELDPALWRQGRDSQLEAAVAMLLKGLQENPVPSIKRPRYPAYNWASIREKVRKKQGSSDRNQ